MVANCDKVVIRENSEATCQKKKKKQSSEATIRVVLFHYFPKLKDDASNIIIIKISILYFNFNIKILYTIDKTNKVLMAFQSIIIVSNNNQGIIVNANNVVLQ